MGFQPPIAATVELQETNDESVVILVDLVIKWSFQRIFQ